MVHMVPFGEVLVCRRLTKEFVMVYAVADRPSAVAVVLALAWLALATAESVQAENATTPGAITTPYPTIVHLAVEWAITGDDNLNGVVSVRYRESGSETWRTGMPLRRVPAGQSQTTTPIFKWTNRHSGSLFDLIPDTEYEIELSLKDPDGGEAVKTVKARTRPVPYAAANAPVKQATPGNLEVGEPGDVVLLADGDYGEVRLQKNGEPDRPIVYRSTSGKAIFKGINASDRKWIYLEGITSTARIKMSGAVRCVVRRCTINSQWGIVAYTPGLTECYIADNRIQGIRPWQPEIMGAGGDNEGEGIEITGAGNVVCHNWVSGFRDCLSHMEDTGTANQVCNDWYNNEVSLGLDDGIEADFAFNNCRILRNRLTNCFVGLSSQPGLGGPTYFIRNAIYNSTYAPFKLHRFSQGDVILHNTVVKVGDGMACFAGQPFDHALFRNNLCIGGPDGGVKWGGYGCGSGNAAGINACGPNSSFDYDGLGTMLPNFHGVINKWQFTSLPNTDPQGYEAHGVKVDMGVFEKLEYPAKGQTQYPAQDMRLKAGAVAVDAGLALPGVNDSFAGGAPDLGAYELGQELPLYGPRPEGIDERTQALPARAGNTVAASHGGTVTAAVVAAPVYGPDRAPTIEKVRAEAQTRLATLIAAHPGVTATLMVDDKATEVQLADAGAEGLSVKLFGGTRKIGWQELNCSMLGGLIEILAAEGDEAYAEHLCAAALLYLIDNKGVESAGALNKMMAADDTQAAIFKELAAKLK